MARIKYFIYLIILQIWHQKKKYFLYIFSFYLGLLLPTFCVGNIRHVNQVIHYTTFDTIKDSVQMDWFSDDFSTIEKDERCSISAVLDEEFTDWNHTYIQLKGIDENYPYPIPEIRGRFFTEKEFEEGKRVCLLAEQYAEEYGCSIGDEITIREERFEIIGMTQNQMYRAILMPYHTMADLDMTNENVQFTGIFFTENNKEKEQIVQEISQQITRRGAEFLGSADGEQLYREAMASKMRWQTARRLAACVAMIFFVLNETILLEGKLKKERQVTGIHLASGAKYMDMKLAFLVEILLIVGASVFLVGISFEPWAHIFSLDNMVVFDYTVVMEVWCLASVSGLFLMLLVTRSWKKMQIADFLKVGNE